MSGLSSVLASSLCPVSAQSHQWFSSSAKASHTLSLAATQSTISQQLKYLTAAFVFVFLIKIYNTEVAGKNCLLQSTLLINSGGIPISKFCWRICLNMTSQSEVVFSDELEERSEDSVLTVSRQTNSSSL